MNPKLKILTVDDIASMRRTVGNMLRELGFSDIDEAEHGEEAFAMLQNGGYGLCISDWNMYPMDGVELVSAVRTDPALRSLPFIMASTEGRSERKQFAMNAGVNAYLVKPYSTEALRDEIEKLLGPIPFAA